MANAGINRRYATSSRITVPTLALGGECSADEHCATSLRAVADDVTGGVVAGAAHWLPEEKPEEVVERLTAFFTGPGP